MSVSTASNFSAFNSIRDASSQRVDIARRRLKALARLLDSAVRVPGTNIHVGLDAVLNLVPGIGTLTAKGLAGYLIWEARRLGALPGLILRMSGNVAVDFVISIIPVVGWFGDAFYRANQRNIELLDAFLHSQPQESGPSPAEHQS